MNSKDLFVLVSMCLGSRESSGLGAQSVLDSEHETTAFQAHLDFLSPQLHVVHPLYMLVAKRELPDL